MEFALVLPMLLVLLLGIADFGRVFQAGITLEALSRNAAEAAAQEYIQLVRSKGSLTSADYDYLHQVAMQEVCAEADVLPNKAIDGLGNCTMPVAAVCIHDTAAGDLACGQPVGSVPPECPDISAWSSTASPSNAAPVDGSTDPLPYVEVRTCYRFTTLFNLHLSLPMSAGLSLGDVWLQRDRQFVVGDY